MKILLYRPNDGFLCEENGTSSPTSYKALSYSSAICAGSIEAAGADVQVLDAGAEQLTMNQSLERINQTEIDVLVITVNCFAAGLAFSGINELKQKKAFFLIAMLTHSMEEEVLFSYPFVDVVIRREWNTALVDVLKAIEKDNDFSEIKGIVFLRDNKVVKTLSREHQLLDDKPMPALHLFPMKLYTAYEIALSEGCNYHCTYCYFRTYPETGWAGRSIERVIEELQYMKSYGNRPVFSIDDELTHDVDYAKKLSASITKARLNMMFSANTRGDKYDEELFALMSEAGFFHLGLGIESGNQNILDKNATMKKLEDVVKTYALIEKYGITTKVYFMIGLLHETQETIRDTFDFIINTLKPYDASFDITIPFPDTPMYAYLRNKGWIESLSTRNLTWIYYHIYGCKQLEYLPMEKPFWRIHDLTFDDLYQFEKKYYHLIPHGSCMAKTLRWLKNIAFLKRSLIMFCETPLETLQRANQMRK